MMRLRILVALAVAFSAASSLAAEKPARRAQPDARQRRCAAEGEGFVYSREADSCIRFGGSVTGEFSSGTPARGGN